MIKKLLIFAYMGMLVLYGYGQSQFQNHGPQVFAAVIQGSHFYKANDGREYIFTVVRGLTARFVGYELSTGNIIVNSELQGTDGAWDMELSTDNILYMTGNGNMYSYTLGDRDVKNLGLVWPNQKVVWDIVAGPNGTIYGGTYPGCLVFEYHPATGYKDVGNGSLQSDENYVRSLAYDYKNNMIYSGIGSKAALVMLDLNSKKKVDILTPQDKDHAFVYDLELISNVTGGDRLIAWLNSSKGTETLIYNLGTKEYEKRLGAIEIKSIAQKVKSNKIYYTAAGTVYELDFSDQNLEPKAIAQIEGKGRAGYVDVNGHYKVLTTSHKVYTIDVVDCSVNDETLLEIPTSPISIQSICWGPDNKVWSSGYLAGNHGSFDPLTGLHQNYLGLHQTEGMNSKGNKIYFGNYAHAELFSYDVTQDWNLAKGNPKFLGAIKNQDRPFAVLPLSNDREILFGTVPSYGQLGGALTHLDINTEEIVTYENIIPNQSLLSLIEIDGKVIGGTSISGGLGAKPSESKGYIFEWDIINKKVLWTACVDNYWSISGLFKGPDNGLWGFSDGSLFKFDLGSRKVVFQKEIYKYDKYPSHIWRNGLAVSHDNGLIYFTLSNKFYSFNPKTNELKHLRDKANLMIQGNGRIYFIQGSDLWSYTPEGYE